MKFREAEEIIIYADILKKVCLLHRPPIDIARGNLE